MSLDSEGDVSGSDSDRGLADDLEALKRACILSGTDPTTTTAAVAINPRHGATSASTSSSDSEDDLELARSIHRRFALSTDVVEPLILKPLCSVPPVGSDDDGYEDDLETLRAIQRRFAEYGKDSQKNSTEDYLLPKQVGATNISSEKECSNNLFVDRTNVGEGFPNSVDASESTPNTELLNGNAVGSQSSSLIEWHDLGAESEASLPVTDSGFPKSAQAFMAAIKKNRACQKFIRNKMIEIEARIEENVKLMKDVKILKDFQFSCRKRTGRALSQKKDARVQFISVPKQRANPKDNEKKVSAMYYGPAENSHVANYRMVLKNYPVSLTQEKWSKEENENLSKGIKQQFQEILLQKSIDLVSGAEGSSEDVNDLDNIIISIRDLDITPENVRSFVPKVNWERLASMYVKGRSGAECEARWLNCEDPLINSHPWTNLEDKNLLHIVQQKGINNWIDVAVSLGTNRTPFQCLARYQRSLNASILKREWTEDEDNKLRAAVEAFGENNWQLVASALEGRTGTQCSNRWIKSLHPARQKVGRWTPDEDKRLKVAAMLYGPKSWNKISQFVPGRTQVQCRERWANCLDPSLNLDEWTEEEDSKLRVGIAEHGYCWSKVATCIPGRTDSQCRRRWKVLLPHEVPLLQAARKVQRAALISNFVDRESERPALGPNDFAPLAIDLVPDTENLSPGKQRRKSRKKPEHYETDGSSRSKRPRKKAHINSGEGLSLTNGDVVENFGVPNKRAPTRRPRKKKCKEPSVEYSSSAMSATEVAELHLESGGNTEIVKVGSPKISFLPSCPTPDVQNYSNLRTSTVRQQKRPKNSKAGDEICYNQTSEREGGGETFGSFEHSGVCQISGRVDKSCSSAKPLEGFQNFSSPRNRSAPDFLSDVPRGATPGILDCGIAPASGVSKNNIHLKSLARHQDCSNQMLEVADEDDMTLAQFLNKLKERKLKLDKNGQDVCSEQFEAV